jgi:hypothetical protein
MGIHTRLNLTKKKQFQKKEKKSDLKWKSKDLPFVSQNVIKLFGVLPIFKTYANVSDGISEHFNSESRTSI